MLYCFVILNLFTILVLIIPYTGILKNTNRSPIEEWRFQVLAVFVQTLLELYNTSEYETDDVKIFFEATILMLWVFLFSMRIALWKVKRDENKKRRND